LVGIGTIVNVLAVVLGSMIGILFNGGLKQKYQDTLMQVLGLSTMFIGVSGTLKEMFVITNSALETKGTMLMIISLVLGALIGEFIDIEDKMDRFGEYLKSKVKNVNNPRFVEGFVTSSIVICVGAMAVVGSLQDGLIGDPSMLYTKSILDGIIVIIFASTMGIGVMFSVIPLGLYQGTITLCAKFVAPILTDLMIANLSFVGSVLIFGVGVNIAFGKKFKVGNMLPALFIVIIGSVFIH
jgi:uncharacterized membrane protein YqgA involved in biofilm formation